MCSFFLQSLLNPSHNNSAFLRCILFLPLHLLLLLLLLPFLRRHTHQCPFLKGLSFECYSHFKHHWLYGTFLDIPPSHEVGSVTIVHSLCCVWSVLHAHGTGTGSSQASIIETLSHLSDKLRIQPSIGYIIIATNSFVFMNG